MGEIYLAVLRRQGAFEKHLVIKRILPSLSTDSEFLAMFNREARIAALLNHQNIVQVYDYGCERGEYFIAMEYVDGADLRTAIKLLGPPPPRAAWALLGGVARGLDYAHRLRSPRGNLLHLVHRDVSPGNVLVSREGEVKLTDFGLVTSGRPEFETEAGAMKGKYGYMSPEQTYGDPVDVRSDVFSWGILAYEVLSGERPFRGNVVETVSAIREVRYEPLSVDGIPDGLTGLVDRCLQRHTDDRPQQAAELLEVLDEVALDAGWRDATKSLATWIRPVATPVRRQTDGDGARTAVGEDPIRDPALHTLAPIPADAPVDGYALTDGEPVATTRNKPRRTNRWWFPVAAAVVAGLLFGAVYFLGADNRGTPPDNVISSTTDLEIVTDPPGAELTIDGEPVGTSPLTVDQLDLVRVYDLETLLAGHQPVERRFRPEDLDLNEDGARVLTVFLPVQPATISIESVPTDVDVFLDGEPQGKTPLTLALNRLGEHWFALEADGFRAEDFHLDVTPGMVETRTFTMVPIYLIHIDGSPRGALATIGLADGASSSSCETPCDVSVEAGTVSVVVSADDHQAHEFRGPITEDFTVDYRLDPLTRRTQVSWRSPDLRLRGGRTLMLSGSPEAQTVNFENDSIQGRLSAQFEERGETVALSLAFQVTPWAIASFDGGHSCETPCTIDLDGVGHGTHRILLQPEGRDPGQEIRLSFRAVVE